MRHADVRSCCGALLLAACGIAAGAAVAGDRASVGAAVAGDYAVAGAALQDRSALTMPGVSDSVRALLHPTTAQIPQFPGEDPNALNPASWPSSLQDSTHRCALQLRTYVRGTPFELRDVRQRKPGQSLSARYLCHSRAWREPHYMGPFYVWDRNDALVERSYRTTDGTRYTEDLYQYRTNGLLWAYRHRERNEDQITGPVYVLDEYFDPDGKLAGFSVERSAPDSLMTRWWRGEAVDAGTFQKWSGEFK